MPSSVRPSGGARGGGGAIWEFASSSLHPRQIIDSGLGREKATYSRFGGTMSLLDPFSVLIITPRGKVQTVIQPLLSFTFDV